MFEANNDFSDSADIVTSSDEYAKRFAGKTGEWFLTVQSDIVISMLKNLKCKTILEVGGGHGQLTGPLCKAGFETTVLGSSDACSKRIERFLRKNKCNFKTGSAVNIPFPDKSFDTVICIRFLSHAIHWQKMIEELCRVAKHAVILDYPPVKSFNLFAPTLFSMKKKIEGDTRKYRVFTEKELYEEFTKNDFIPENTMKEFFLPMVLHRVMKSRHVSAFFESVFKRLFITGFYGSPAIMLAIRNGSGHLVRRPKLTFWGFRVQKNEKNNMQED